MRHSVVQKRFDFRQIHFSRTVIFVKFIAARSQEIVNCVLYIPSSLSDTRPCSATEQAASSTLWQRLIAG